MWERLRDNEIPQLPMLICLFNQARVNVRCQGSLISLVVRLVFLAIFSLGKGLAGRFLFFCGVTFVPPSVLLGVLEWATCVKDIVWWGVWLGRHIC